MVNKYLCISQYLNCTRSGFNQVGHCFTTGPSRQRHKALFWLIVGNALRPDLMPLLHTRIRPQERDTSDLGFPRRSAVRGLFFPETSERVLIIRDV